MYTFLFFVRFYPFWAIPLALVAFELGVYHFNRRERFGFLPAFAFAAFLVITSILWLVFEGYWRAGPFFKSILELKPPSA